MYNRTYHTEDRDTIARVVAEAPIAPETAQIKLLASGIPIYERLFSGGIDLEGYLDRCIGEGIAPFTSLTQKRSLAGRIIWDFTFGKSLIAPVLNTLPEAAQRRVSGTSCGCYKIHQRKLNIKDSEHYELAVKETLPLLLADSYQISEFGLSFLVASESPGQNCKISLDFVPKTLTLTVYGNISEEPEINTGFISECKEWLETLLGSTN